MNTLIGIIIGFIILALLVIAHEMGHAIAARHSGVVVEEFGIGMPPRIWSKKLKNGIILSINWLMFGGFVKLQGEFDEAKNKGDYGAVSFWNKTKILFAGVTVNWFVAVLILTVLSITGMPKILDNQFIVKNDASTLLKPIEVVSVVTDQAAFKAGIKTGDIITEFDGQKVNTDEQLIGLIGLKKGKEVTVAVVRDDAKLDFKAVLGTDLDSGYLGVGLGQRKYVRSTWSAPIVGVATTAQFTWETAKGIVQLVSDLSTNFVKKFNSDVNVRNDASAKLKAVGDGVTGPVGIVGTIFPSASQSGPTQIALIAAIISISLAVMNIFPIPVLDGGRWFTMALFKLFKKNLTIKREEKIQTLGFLVMMGLVFVVTVIDVKRLF